MANVILVIHFLYALFIILGFVYIWTGYFAGLQSIHNPVFRYAHMAAMGIVVLESLFGIVCPLSWLENMLRMNSGSPVYEEGFIPYWIHRLLFYDLPPWVFTIIYVAFFVLMILTIYLIPIHKSHKKREDS